MAYPSNDGAMASLPRNAPPIIDVRDLSKGFRSFRRREGVWGAVQNLFVREYKTVEAVRNVSFTIQRGEMVGYIGPNGAGKSTTIKMLTGILVPSSGEAHVNGFVPYRQRRQYVKTIGVVFGQRTQLWWDIAVVESFKILAPNLRCFAAGLRRAHGAFQSHPEDRRLSAHPGAQALPGRAHALRYGRGAAAQSAACCSSMSPPSGWT